MPSSLLSSHACMLRLFYMPAAMCSTDFFGTIDEMRVWSKARTQQQVSVQHARWLPIVPAARGQLHPLVLLSSRAVEVHLPPSRRLPAGLQIQDGMRANLFRKVWRAGLSGRGCLAAARKWQVRRCRRRWRQRLTGTANARLPPTATRARVLISTCVTSPALPHAVQGVTGQSFDAPGVDPHDPDLVAYWQVN